MNRPWMPLYIADYRADTAHLSAAQHGAYLLLIMHYWQTGSLPQDESALARISCMTPSEWKKSRPVVAAFFTSKWAHKRIDAELAKSAEISSKRAASAKQRHSNSSANADANAEQLDTHARALPQSLSQKKDYPAGAGSSKYAFESGVIRLDQKDFDLWQSSYSHLELRAELLSLTDWAGTLGPKRWFHAVQKALANKNREVKAKKEQLAEQGGFKWNGIEGVL